MIHTKVKNAQPTSSPEQFVKEVMDRIEKMDQQEKSAAKQRLVRRVESLMTLYDRLPEVLNLAERDPGFAMIWKGTPDKVRQVFKDHQVQGVDPERDPPRKVHDALARILETAREPAVGLETLKNARGKPTRTDCLPVRRVPR